MVIRVQSFPVYFESLSGIEMQQITVAIWDILLTVETRNDVQERGRETVMCDDFSNIPNLGIVEAEEIRFQNADRLVDYSGQ